MMLYIPNWKLKLKLKRYEFQTENLNLCSRKGINYDIYIHNEKIVIYVLDNH
jgi:hypothetical protein